MSLKQEKQVCLDTLKVTLWKTWCSDIIHLFSNVFLSLEMYSTHITFHKNLNFLLFVQLFFSDITTIIGYQKAALMLPSPARLHLCVPQFPVITATEQRKSDTTQLP